MVEFCPIFPVHHPVWYCAEHRVQATHRPPESSFSAVTAPFTAPLVTTHRVIQRILIVRPSALGDVCRTVPLLVSLRRHFADARIDWVVQDAFAPALEAHPDVNQAIYFPRKRFARWWRDLGAARGMLNWIRELRRTRYDIVIDAQGLSRSGLITRATGSPMRIGPRDAREFAWLAYTHRLGNSKIKNQSSKVHTVDRMLALLEPLDVEPVRDMRLYVPPDAQAWWDVERDQLELTGARYAVFAPTARWSSKRWPIERWTELVRPLLMHGFERILILGAPDEAEQVKPIAEYVMQHDSPLVNFVGRTSIAQTMAVIAQSSLVIANDSAPLHMGVGFNRPCVGLFGPTDPDVVGPYGMPHAALRAFRPKPGEIINYRDEKLGDRLMRVISSAAVIQQIGRVLDAHAAQEQGEMTPNAAANRVVQHKEGASE